MRKAEQIVINEKCNIIGDIVDKSISVNGWGTATKLRSCNARVYHIPEGHILESYNTPVAFIDNSGNLYDFLRCAYGYTSTSAQHIAKFGYDYGEKARFTWREV